MSFQVLKATVGNSKHFPAFEAYHTTNPHVYNWFVRFTLEAIHSGRKRYGAHAVVQRIRWEHDIHTTQTDEFKISNCHFPFYARLFMLDHPQYAGFFKTKKLK